MLSTYKAILRGDRLEWSGEEPVSVPTDRGVEVFVTILEEKASAREQQSRGRAMAASLERLAQAGGVPAISDPLRWERELRDDRPLPGRKS